jgi:hypothetical protein
MATLPDISAAEFQTGAPIDNPFFPLPPGTIFSYGGTKIDEDTGEVAVERNNVFVTFETQEIASATTKVVRNTEYANGVLVEDTIDRYAQDTEGNVWYFGEVTFSFEYDDEGNFVETSTEGSWEAGVDGAQPGHIMPADPGFGAGYFQEFAPGVAEDEAIVVGVDQEVTIGLGEFDGVLQTLDTTALEPDMAEYKYYAPGVGQVLEEALDEEGAVEFANELLGIRAVGPDGVDQGNERDANDVTLGDLIERKPFDLDGAEEPEAVDFLGDGSERQVTFLGGEAGLSNALGAYSFDAETGEIGEGRILFADTADLAAGTTATVEVADGEGLGLFLVPGGADLGLDLSEFEEGGLFFTNFVSGEAATLGDGLAPLVTDAEGLEGEVLPITTFHALDDDPADGFNFLNPAAGVHAADFEMDVAEAAATNGKVEVLGFEELLTTDPGFDGDYDDVLVGVGSAPLAPEVAEADPLLV